MTRSALRTRRLLVLALIVVAMGVGFLSFYVLRSNARANFLSESRAEGLAAHAEGDYERSLRKLSYVLRNDRSDLEVLVAFAEARSRTPVPNHRHHLEAVRIYQTALDIDPTNETSLLGLLLLYEQLRRHVEWLDVAQRVLALDENNIDALRLAALGHRIALRFDEASEAAIRLIELEPENIQWRNLQLALLRDRGVPIEDLLALCRSWNQTHHGDGRYLLMEAQLLGLAGNINGAREVLREAAARGAESLDLLRPMLALLETFELRSEADELLSRTIQAFPGEQWPREASVRRHWQSGRIAEGLEEISALEAEHGLLTRDLLRWQGLLLITSGDYEGADRTLDELAMRSENKDPRVRDADRGWIAAMRGRMAVGSAPWPEILAAYRTALALSPADPVLHFLEGEAYAYLSEHELATSAFARAHRLDPNWHSARVRYAEGLLNVGDASAAYRLLQDTVQRGEGGIDPYVLFARAWLASNRATDEIPEIIDANTGRPVSIVDLLRRIHEVVPDSAEVCELLVRAALQYSYHELALSTIEDVLDRHEPNPDLLANLARISLRKELGLESMLVRRAEELTGLTPPLAAVLARVHHASGRTDESLRVLKGTIERFPTGHELHLVARRVQAAFLVETGHEGAVEALSALLDLEDSLPDTSSYVLSQPVTWENRDLTERAIQQLADIVGPSSPRLAVLRGHFVLRYTPGDAAEVARAQSITADALQVAPDSLAALDLMSRLALTGDSPQIDVAIRYLERALAVQPERADLYLRIVDLHQQKGNYREAEQYLNRFAGLATVEQELLRSEVQLLEIQGEFDRAVTRLAAAIDGSASKADRLLLFSRLHLTGRHAEAEQVLNDLLDSAERDEATVRLAAEFYANRGRYEEGLALLRSYQPEGGEAATAVMLGRFYHYNRQYGQAQAAYESALRRDPENREALIQLSRLLASAQNEESLLRSLEVAKQGLSAHPANTDLQLLVLMTSWTLGGRERVVGLNLLAESHHLDEQLRDVVVLGIRAAEQGTSRPLRDHLTEARRLTEKHPRFLPAWTLAIELHMQANDLETALRLAKQAPARMPYLVEPARLAAHLLAQHGRFEEAEEMGRLWRQRSLNRPIDADFFLASVSLALDRPREAVSHLAPHTENVLTALAEPDIETEERLRIWMYAHLRAGLSEYALAHLRPLFRSMQPTASAWRSAWLEATGLLHESLAREALSAIEPDLRNEPAWTLSLASAWSRFAQKFSDSQAFDRAEQLASTAAERDAHLEAPSLMIRAQNADWRDDASAAERFLRSALALMPDHPIVLNNLADLIVRSGRNCDEAASLVSRASKLAPELPEILDTHANAMLCLNNGGEAESLARQAIARRPDSSDFLVTLGLALAAQERWDEAASTLRRLERVLEESAEPKSRTFATRFARLQELITINTAQIMPPADETFAEAAGSVYDRSRGTR